MTSNHRSGSRGLAGFIFALAAVFLFQNNSTLAQEDLYVLFNLDHGKFVRGFGNLGLAWSTCKE